ncbi:MAG: hypothetical protein Rubg2KO_24780 [Rubricoccaceae bacterium]
MRRIGRSIGWVVSALAILIGARGLLLLATTPAQDTEGWDARTVAQLRFLSDDLDGHADAMQRLFPEGRAFTLALTGLGWTNLGIQDAAPRDLALANARHALELAENSVSRQPFPRAGSLPNGIFYEAWTTRLRLGIAQLAGSNTTQAESDTLASSCLRLDLAYIRTPAFVDSYPGAAWPADNVVGAAALAGCGALLDSAYTQTAQEWLIRAQAHEDPETGLLPHAAHSPQARGSSAALMIPFLAEIDSAYAQTQYERFLAAFETQMLGVLPAIREYPRSFEGTGDIDSGPIVLGAGAPASVVGIAAARSVGDLETAQALRASAERLGLAFTWNDQRRYLFGEMPVGDAFLAWASSVSPARGEIETGAYSGWRGRWGLASALGLLVGLGGGVWLWRRRAPRGTQSP